MLTFKTTAFNTNGVYGEISDPIKKRIIHDVPIVSSKKAKLILAKLGKLDIEKHNNYHYSRTIGELGRVEKVMVGKPLIE